jgi:hypothetical protein
MATPSVLTPAQFAASFNLTPPTTGQVGAAATSAQYITQNGDRWDLIAYRMYGDSSQIQVLVNANPNLPLRCTFAGGIQVIGPLLPPPAAPTTSTPWQP